jgi:hypothetical protein
MKNADVFEDLKSLLDDQKVEEVDPTEGAIMQHLALAAQVAGVDLSDDKAVAEFMAAVKTVVTKDKAALKSQLRRWTSAKGKNALRSTKNAI